MSVDGFPPPADKCSCLVDGCDWLDQDCCKTKVFEVDEMCRVQEGLDQCPNLLAHYSKQHSITTSEAWRPSTFTFRIPEHSAGSPCLGPWSPFLSPSLQTPGLAWWLQGFVTGSEIKLTVKVADRGLTGLAPYWLIKPEKKQFADMHSTTMEQVMEEVLNGNPSEDLGCARIMKKEESSWVDLTTRDENKIIVWLDMNVSFEFDLEKVNFDECQLMIQLDLGMKAWETLGVTPDDFTSSNDEEDEEKLKIDLINENDKALLEGSDKCEICTEKPKPGKYLNCPGEAQHKFCFPCWDAMAYKTFFESCDVFCPVCQSCPNSCGEEMPWSCKESDKRTYIILSKVQTETLRREKLKDLKDKREKKQKKNRRSVIKSGNAGGQDLEEDHETFHEKFPEDTVKKDRKQKNDMKSFKEKQLKVLKGENEVLQTLDPEKQKFSKVEQCKEAVSDVNIADQFTPGSQKINNDDDQQKDDAKKRIELKKPHKTNVNLFKKGQEEKNMTTGARPKVRSTINMHLPQVENSHMAAGSLSKPINEGRDEIKIVFETVKATTACENHVIELLTRGAINSFDILSRSQAIPCLNCQALWCQNCISKCEQCMKATYCNKVCQVSDWGIHRQLCKEESEGEEMGVKT